MKSANVKNIISTVPANIDAVLKNFSWNNDFSHAFTLTDNEMRQIMELTCEMELPVFVSKIVDNILSM